MGRQSGDDAQTADTRALEDRQSNLDTVVDHRNEQDHHRGSAWQVGDRIGRYVVVGIAGTGAMGVVLSAYDPELNRRVAIKLVRKEYAHDYRARLLREAQAMARLRHPGVVSVHETGQTRGQMYLVMEYVDGVTLLDRQKELGPECWREILALYVAAGRGLAAAHEAGVVHRDFKPANVLVDESGRVQVADFGISAVSGESDPGADTAPALTSPQSDLTRPGQVMGTPRYMAPEQHLGVADDATVDQFAFCASLYEALYGQPPFAGTSEAALITQKMDGEIAPPPTHTPVPRWVHDAVVRGLAPDSDRRYPTLTGLLDELDPDIQGSINTRARSRARTVLILGLLCALFPIGGFVHNRQFGDGGHLGAGLIDIALLLMAGIVWVRGRQLISRSPINAVLLGLVTATFAGHPLVLYVAIQFGLSPGESAVLRGLIWSVVAACAAITIDRRMWPACGALVVAVIVSATWLELRWLCMLFGITALTANAYLLALSRARSAEPEASGRP